MAMRPKPRPSAAPAASRRPAERPSTRAEREAVERGNRAAERGDMTRSEMEAAAGMKKGGKVKKMAKGGTCRGMGAATRGGKYRMS